MNQNQADVVINVGYKFKLSNTEIEKIKNAYYGGGDTVAGFFNVLLDPNNTIRVEDVRAALSRLELLKAEKEWKKLTEHQTYCYEVKMYEIYPMMKFLNETPNNPAKKCWIQLAEELDNFPMEEIENIQELKRTVGNYSPAEALLTELENAGFTIEEVLSKLLEVDADKDMARCVNVIKLLEDDITKAVQKELRRWVSLMFYIWMMTLYYSTKNNIIFCNCKGSSFFNISFIEIWNINFGLFSSKGQYHLEFFFDFRVYTSAIKSRSFLPNQKIIESCLKLDKYAFKVDLLEWL